MKSDEAGQVLSMLTAGFHRETLEEQTVDLWIDVLEPLDAEIATKVALEWIRSEDRFPTISQYRHAYHVERKQQEPRELSAAHGPTGFMGLPTTNRPQWVDRWERARKHANQIEDLEKRLEIGDWRVFPEQVAEGAKYHDDPRYTLAEADEIGIMPEDVWAD